MAGQRLNRFWTNSKKDDPYFPDGSGQLKGAIEVLLLQLKIVCPEKLQFRTANHREIPISDQIGRWVQPIWDFSCVLPGPMTKARICL